MKDSSLLGHGILAIGATVLAYAAWQAPASSSVSEEVVIVPGSKESLSEVSWEEERYEVTVKRQGEDVAVSVLTKPQPVNQPAKDNPKDDETEQAGGTKGDDAAGTGGDSAKPEKAQPQEAKPEEPQPEPKTKTYPGTKQAAEMLDKLVPLKASRSLGAVEEERLEDLGLGRPHTKLTLRFGTDVQHSVDIGNTTYGSGDIYARGEDGKVYLLRSNLVSGLRYGGSSLLDRDATGVEREKIERVVIHHNGNEREVVYRHAENKAKSFFADPAEPDTKLDKLSGWLDRILRLRVSDLSDEPAPTAPPGVTVDLFGSGGELGKVSLWEPGDAKQATIITSRFAGPVLVSSASARALLRDVQEILNEGK